ncbi:MAG TPA: efflux RND transporter periplasmic adaptor subunit [Thermoanaerobaculia bacterium]|nr:efflux RND transporter periplasmic adaptor subunit [Thermoanaerobaculia bacterium]
MIRSLKGSLVLLSVAFAAFACAGKKAPSQQNAAAPSLPADVQSVAAAVVAPAPAANASAAEPESTGTIVATGEFISPVRSELSARIPGRVGRLYVDEGSLVREGDPLLELETDYTRLNLQKAEADAARAAAAEQDALRDLARKKELIAKQSIPQATFDRTQATYDQAHAAKESMLAQAAIYRQQLSDSVLRSPINGVVAEKRTNVGQRLGDNTVALVVTQTQPLKLRFRVPEKDLARVHRGQLVKATADPYPGVVFEGKVTTVGGVIDPATRSFFVETEFANKDNRLRPGLFARVEMEPMQ